MTLAPAAVGARCSGPDRRGPRGIRGGHHARRSGLFDLHLASLLAPRPVDGLEGANDTQTLPRPRERLGPILDAIEKVLALVLGRLTHNHLGDADVPLADAHAKGRERIDQVRVAAFVVHLLVVNPKRLRKGSVVEGQHLLVSDESDVAHLAGVEPGRVEVDENFARIAQSGEYRVRDVFVDPGTPRAETLNGSAASQ